MFRLYREPEIGEFFVVFGDTAQGGIDKNFVQFLSTKRLDIPLVLAMHGTAAEMTPLLIAALRWLNKKTDVKPTVALERQNGGASAMHDLMMANHDDAYTLYISKQVGEETGENDTTKLGWDTTAISRPKMLGEWLAAFNSKQVTVYDQETLEQHATFIVNKNGKPEAAPNTHDDGVISAAGAWQMYQTEQPPVNDAGKVYTTGNLASAWQT